MIKMLCDSIFPHSVEMSMTFTAESFLIYIFPQEKAPLDSIPAFQYCHLWLQPESLIISFQQLQFVR